MRFAVLFILLGASLPAWAQTGRVEQELADGWRFVRADVGLRVDAMAGEPITIPHTWNNLDGQDGRSSDPRLRDGYFRSACWYVRPLKFAPEWAGRRVFLRFEAASVVTDVWVNETHLGQHRGAFAAFAFELTGHLKRDGENLIRVRVDNSRFEDVAPLQGDFTVFGGIYRPVHLIITDEVNITPLYYGSAGVFITPRTISDTVATIDVRTLLSSTVEPGAAVEVGTIVSDADGKVVARLRTPVEIAPSLVVRRVVQTLHIPRPRRWHGREDPYLYTVDVSVHREGRTADQVRQPLGLRTIEITDERGVLLNGRPYATYGVNRHQDRLDKGWALSRADHEEDIAMIVELGATSLRLAHYQQSDVVHDLCDRAGLLVWQEIPLVDRITSLPEFAANARQQLTEMILQGYNHPSLCFWGLFNELESTWAEKPGPPSDDLIRDLRRLAGELDPSRPVVAASSIRTASPLHEIPDAIAFNVFPGWYWGTPEDFGPLVGEMSGHLGGRRIAISEYGAGGSVFQHEDGPVRPPVNTATRFHPEEWQTRFHERIWAQAHDDPRLWGTWVWSMFDFASDQRDEGDAAGRNDKGLVTYDRKVRKDAFYFYQANWTSEPMVYIAGNRFTRRTEAIQDVHVYSTCPVVELYLNGASLGAARPDETRVFRWPAVRLTSGVNRIEAVAECDGIEYRTSCEWLLTRDPQEPLDTRR